MEQSGWGYWESSWVISLVLIGLTIALHVGGIVFLTRVSRRFWDAPLRRRLTEQQHHTMTAILVIAAIAVSLALLHGLEAMFWAFAYLTVGALQTPADAVLYSVDSMTTRGASGFALDPRWRMMGAIESLDGMLLFGISTAFLFAVMQRLLIFAPWRER